ncbi:MAG: leucine-rich repeat domain-containing protein [Eubacterium sp.]|nr:leucine-rich repeat domain-containing protein [Eubacterium sp.]
MKKIKSMMGLFLSTVLITASVNTGFSAESLNPAYEEAERLLSGAALTAEITQGDKGESFGKTQIETAEITQAEFESSGTYGDITYSYDETTGVLTLTGEGAMADIDNSSQAAEQQPWYSCRESIKKVIAEEGITGIGDYAFYGCTGLTEIALSSTVVSIGSGAFYNCSSLENTVFPNSLTSIGMNAFYGCSSLTEIVLPENIDTVNDGAFRNCTGLKTITFPNNGTTVSNLKRDVFYGCTSLESVIMEGGIKYIEAYAFYGCTSLKNIDITESNKYIVMYAF